jgi:Transglycosylase SLT domain
VPTVPRRTARATSAPPTARTYWRRRLALLVVLAAACLAVALVILDGEDESDGIPTDPDELAAGLTEADAGVRSGIADWRDEAAGGGAVPEDVSEDANYIHDAAQLLAERRKLAAETIPQLDPGLAHQTRELTAVAGNFLKLGGGGEAPELETQEPRPLPELIGYYEKAERRFEIGWNYLAAIHAVETKFGRVVSESVAGAQGPMQFIPETWETYGMGGDIQDPHDAILGAANLLRQNGAPADYPGALIHYNPSRAYVDAIQRYAGLIETDPDAVYLLYSWEV